MRSNSVPVQLPIVAAGVGAATAPIDVSRGFNGFTVQFDDVNAATGVQYAVEVSLDCETWFDMTYCLHNLASAGAAVGSPITADSVYDYSSRFPGVMRIACKHVPDAAPTVVPSAVVAFQDSTQT